MALPGMVALIMVAINLMTDYLKLKNTDHTGPVLPRQGEPGTAQYIRDLLA